MQTRPGLQLQTPERPVDVGTRFRVLVLGLCLVFGILIASCAVSTDHDRRGYSTIQATPPSQAAFDYVVVIVMNNASAKQVYGSSAAPYLNSLASTYGYAPPIPMSKRLLAIPTILPSSAAVLSV